MKTVLDELEEDVLVVEESGVIKFVGRALAQKLGYTQDEILQLNIEEILQVDWEDWEIKRYGETRVDLQTRSGNILTYKMQVFKDEWNGEHVWYVLGEHVPLGEASEDEARSILEQLPMMIASKSLEGKYMYMNKACRDYYEYHSEEYLGKNDIEIYGELAGEIYQNKDNQIIQEAVPEYIENWVKTQTGKMRLINVYKSPLYDAAQEVCGLIKFADEITMKKWVELEQKHQLNQVFKLMETGKSEASCKDITLKEQLIKEVLKDIKAEGMAIWVYDATREQLVCKFATPFNQHLAREALEAELLGCTVAYAHKGSRNQEIKPLEQVDFMELEDLSIREKLQERGIQHVGVFDITDGSEFLGVVNLLYKQYEVSDRELINWIQKICNKLGDHIKRVRVTKELEKTLKKRMQTEAELGELLSVVSDGVWVSDESHKLLKVNRGICEMMGVSEAELLKKGILNYIHEEDKSFMSYTRRQCRAYPGEINRMIMRIPHTSGELVWMECGVKYIMDKQIYVYTGKNVTSKYQFKKQQSLYAQKRQLQILKEEFLSHISQELQEPLNSLWVKQQMLEQGLKVCNTEKYKGYIKKNIYRLMRLVNNLIDSTHIVAGEYEMKKKNYELVGVVGDIARTAARYAVYKGITLYFETDLSKQVIGCDIDKIDRVILNLIANAIKYTPRGGRITIRLRKQADQIVLEVEDNGIGIPKEQLENIFEQFMQVDVSLTRQNEGSGIGLSLAKLFVSLHEGKIYAQSTLGKGTRITVELPNRRVKGCLLEASRGELATHRMERCRIEFADIYDLD
ncbi:MAG: ATP-binding protein [Cellulosilyticaceae bacterium]